ncbi:MAG: hypothetical protein ABSA16_08190 [Thermoguttaceae bacterium]|jgi:hypothetical protein
MESEHQIPIWFFIGALLGVYGVIILVTGIYLVFFPPPADQQLALSNLHADIWWGAMMTILGSFYCIRFRPK